MMEESKAMDGKSDLVGYISKIHVSDSVNIYSTLICTYLLFTHTHIASNLRLKLYF